MCTVDVAMPGTDFLKEGYEISGIRRILKLEFIQEQNPKDEPVLWIGDAPWSLIIHRTEVHTE